MNPTPEQEKAIRTTNRTVLLSAAAGSGKTATLTERLIRMITREDEPLDVSRMLIATFTRAAAEELRSRISAALSRAVAERPNDERLARQTLLLPTARIRTIDGFCNEIVKGHTASLGISPLYRIASEAQTDLLGVKLMNEVIEDAYGGDFAPEGLDVVALVESVESVRESGSLAADLYRLYKTSLAALPEGVLVLKHNADELEKEAALPFFETRAGRAFSRHYAAHYKSKRDVLRTLLDRLLEAEGNASPTVLSYWDKAMGLLHHYTLAAEAAERAYGEMKSIVAAYATVKKKTVKDDTPPSSDALFFAATVESLADECAKERKSTPFPWNEEDLPYAFRASAALCRTVYLLVAEFEKRFLEEKRRQGICDYADLERYAYGLLWDAEGNRTPLACEMAASFDAICIDEYQDVNEMQHRIFEALSTPHNRFMVGDIKQSIYGFRGGEPDIFARLRATFPSLEEEGDDAVLFLTKNFRSERAVIDLANGVFDFLFPIVGDRIGYRTEDRLVTDREPNDKVPLPTVCLMKTPAESENAEGLDKATLKSENDLVAEHVLWLLAHGKKKDGTRVLPADIVVMSRGGRAMDELVKTLRTHGIPLQTEDKTDFFAHKEILLAVSLCHTVNNPHHDLHLSATLRSPLYGFTLDDLICIRDAVPKGASLYDGVRARAEEGDGRYVRFLADVERFRALAENTPAHRLIRTLFEQTGIYAATDKDGRTRLRIFYELARSYEESAYRGLYRFLQRIAELREFGGSAVDKQVVGKTDAVRVMTIHKSKGLEAPVCILAHTGTGLGGEGHTPTFRFSPELGLFSTVTDETGLATLKTPLAQAVGFAAKEKETDEAIRVLYVALTRAVEQMYVFGAAKKKHLKTMQSDAALIRACPSRALLFEKASYATWMLAALGEDSPLCEMHFLDAPYELPLPALPNDAAPERTEDAPAGTAEQAPQTANAEETNAYLALYRERFAFRYPHEAETRLPAKLSVSSLYPGVLDELAERSPFDTPAEPTHPASLLDGADATGNAPAAPQEGTDTFTPTLPAFLSGKEENAAAKAGTATHLFLQFCDFDRILLTDGSQNGEAVIQDELARLEDGGYLLPDDVARVRTDELAAFLSSPCAALLRERRKCYREFRFHAHLPASLFSERDKDAYEGLTVFVQGVVDLLVERADGSLVLLDYKTDRIPRECLGNTERERAFLWARHDEQLSLYGKAVEKIFGKAPALAIYSLHAGKLLYAPK